MEEPIFFIWLVDDNDSDDVILEDDEDVDVEICEALLWPSMFFFISAIVFCISPRPCLTASAEVVAALEDEDDEDVISRCVDEALAIWTLDVLVVLLLDEEVTLELLLLEVAFRSFFVILYRRFLGIYLERYFIHKSVFHFALAYIALSQCTSLKLFLSNGNRFI